MKIIHTADLHLDSTLERLSPSMARERNAELAENFVRLVDYARENGVRAVLLVGDVFDSPRCSELTVSLVLDSIRKAPQIYFLWLCGNHDGGAIILDRELPKNLLRFSDTWQGYDFGDAVIWGAELNADNCYTIYDTLRLDADRCNLVLLHGEASNAAGADKICLPRLRDRGIDYLALGHIHGYGSGRLDDRGVWVDPGCLEGRGFDECGDKGFVLLDVQNGCVSHEFIPFARRRLHEISVDISGLTAVTELRDALLNAADGIPTGDLARFVLTGTYTAGTQKELNYLRRSLEGAFYYFDIRDESRLELRPEDYMNDVSLRGEFIRTVMASDMEEADRDAVLMLGLRALSGQGVEL